MEKQIVIVNMLHLSAGDYRHISMSPNTSNRTVIHTTSQIKSFCMPRFLNSIYKSSKRSNMKYCDVKLFYPKLYNSFTFIH